MLARPLAQDLEHVRRGRAALAHVAHPLLSKHAAHMPGRDSALAARGGAGVAATASWSLGSGPGAPPAGGGEAARESGRDGGAVAAADAISNGAPLAAGSS